MTLIHETAHYLNDYKNPSRKTSGSYEFYNNEKGTGYLHVQRNSDGAEAGYIFENAIWGNPNYNPEQRNDPYKSPGNEVLEIRSSKYVPGEIEKVVNELLKTKEGRGSLPSVPKKSKSSSLNNPIK